MGSLDTHSVTSHILGLTWTWMLVLSLKFETSNLNLRGVKNACFYFFAFKWIKVRIAGKIEKKSLCSTWYCECKFGIRYNCCFFLGGLNGSRITGIAARSLLTISLVTPYFSCKHEFLSCEHELVLKSATCNLKWFAQVMHLHLQ